MVRGLRGAACVAAFVCGSVTDVSADIVCPDSSYCAINFANPTRDRITISPNRGGDTFAGAGITVRVFLKNCTGAPLVGVPAQEVVIFNSALCICPGGNIADAATDANGMTTFSATIRGGGCVESLTIFADGVQLCNTPLKTNSWDWIHSPCFVDAGDLAALSARLRSAVGQPNYNICFDWTEDGFIDSSDVASFASHLGEACQ
jgi:hypothetical protein